MNIAITGGSGFVGTSLARALVREGYRITVYDRIPPKFSHDLMTFVPANLSDDGAPESVAHHDAIVHLAGVSIYERWTPAYKQEILTSRKKSTRSIVEACRVSAKKPSVFVCASAVGYYGDQGERELPEDAPAGNDFLAEVCQKWEKAASEIESQGIRRVSVRTAIVLGPGGGMMSKLLPLFRWGLGGRLGSGRQWFSWIHIDDLVAVYREAILNPNLSGPVNATAPQPVTNNVFTRELARALHRFAPLIVPGFALRFILGEFAGAVLASTRAVPAKLLAQGFSFQYPSIRSAVSTFSTKK